MAEINMATEWVRLFEKISDDVRAVSSEFREKDATGNMSVKDKRMIGKQGTLRHTLFIPLERVYSISSGVAL